MSDQYGFDNIAFYPEIGQPTWLELITVSDSPSGLKIHREMVDPSVYRTVGSLALVYSKDPDSVYVVRERDGHLEPASFGDQTESKMTVVTVAGDLNPDAVAATLRSLPTVMPSRMRWGV